MQFPPPNRSPAGGADRGSSTVGTGIQVAEQRLGASRRVWQQKENLRNFQGIAGPIGTPGTVFVHSERASSIQQAAQTASASAAQEARETAHKMSLPNNNGDAPQQHLRPLKEHDVASSSRRGSTVVVDDASPVSVNRGSLAARTNSALLSLQPVMNTSATANINAATGSALIASQQIGASISFKREGSAVAGGSDSILRPPALQQLERSKIKSYSNMQSWEPQPAEKAPELPSLLSEVPVPVSTFSGAVPITVPPTPNMYQPYDVTRGTLEQEHELRELKGELPMSALLAGKGKKKAAAPAQAGTGEAAFLTGTDMETGSGGLDAQRKSIASRGGSAGATRRPSLKKKANKISLPNPFESLPEVRKKPLPSNLVALHRALYPKVINRPDYTGGISSNSHNPIRLTPADGSDSSPNSLKICLQDVLDYLASLMPPEFAEGAAEAYLRPWLKAVAVAAGCGGGDASAEAMSTIAATPPPPSSAGNRSFAPSPTRFGLQGGSNADFLAETDGGRGRSAGSNITNTANALDGGTYRPPNSARSNTVHSARRNSRTSTLSDRALPQVGGSHIQQLLQRQRQRIAYFHETYIPYSALLEAFIELVEPPLPIEEQPKGFGSPVGEDDESNPDAAYKRELLKNYNEDNCGANVSARICFDLVDFPKRGYIIRSSVVARRDDRLGAAAAAASAFSPSATPEEQHAVDYNFAVAQGVMRGFELIGALEEERYIAIAKKKKKGKKKKLTGAEVLPNIHQFHMSCDEFAHLLAVDGFLVQSFLPYIIKTAMNGVRDSYLAAGTANRYFGKSQVSANAIRKTEKRTNEAAAAVLSSAAETAVHRASNAMNMRRRSNAASAGPSRRVSTSSAPSI